MHEPTANWLMLVQDQLLTPIYAPADGRRLAYEAEMRWFDTTQGLHLFVYRKHFKCYNSIYTYVTP